MIQKRRRANQLLGGVVASINWNLPNALNHDKN